MNGEVTALISAICYAVSNLLLRKGQKDTYPSDNGLFPILFVSGAILLLYFVIDLVEDPAPLVVGGHWVKSITFCALSGVVATLFGRLALYATISRIGAARGVIFIALAPFVSLLIAIAILGEKVHLWDIVGISILFGGVALLLCENKLLPKRFPSASVVSIGIAVCATVFQGVGYSFRKVGVEFPIDPVFASALDTTAAILMYMLILGSFGKLKQVLHYYATHLNLYILCAGFVMAAAVFLFFNSVLETPLSKVSVIMGTQPVIVAILAGIFMKNLERITWVTIVSACLVSVGVIFISL